MVSQILSYLNWEEMAQLLVACPAREDLRQELLNNTGLFRQVFVLNTKRDLERPVGLLKLNPVSLLSPSNRRVQIEFKGLKAEELLNLEAEEILAVRLEIGGNTRDHQMPCLLKQVLPKGRPRHTELASFNPCHPIVATVVTPNELTVFNYGPERFETGSQLYTHRLACPNAEEAIMLYDEPELHFVALRWSPGGQFLMAVCVPRAAWKIDQESLTETFEEGKVFASLLLFRYHQGTFRMVQFPEEEIKFDPTMLSHNMWTSENSFLMACPPNRTGLYHFVLDCDNLETPKLTVTRLLKDCHAPEPGLISDLKLLHNQEVRGAAKRIFMKRSRTLSFVGSYFGLGTEKWSECSYGTTPVFGCVTGCPKQHCHQRLVIFISDRSGGYTPWYTVDIPGHLMSLEVLEQRVYMLYKFELPTSLHRPWCVAETHEDAHYGCKLRTCETELHKLLFECPLNTGEGFKTLESLQRDEFNLGRYGLSYFDFKEGVVVDLNR